jgi:hydrogenase nickel incorporation protein HypA/HybF
MHEMTLCENIMRIVQEQARQQRFTRVTEVCLEIGALACVEPEAMRFCFAAVSQGTLAAGAHLDIAARPARAWCLSCERTVAVNRRLQGCPQCGEEVLGLNGGDELRVIDLEVE